MKDLETFVKSTKEEKEQAGIFDCDTTIIADNLAFEPDENLDAKAQELIRRDLSLDIRVVRTTRMRAPPPRTTRRGDIVKPGLVKIQVPTLDDKIKILRQKRMLENSASHSRVSLRSSKPHNVRLMEQNFKVMFDMMDCKRDYMITGNGRIVKRTEKERAEGPA